MPKNNRTVDERPYRNLRELLDDYDYDTSDANYQKSVEQASQKLQFVKSVIELKEEIENDFGTPRDYGTVYGITGPWGTGKTSFKNILLDELGRSSKIQSDNLCIYTYETLYYGNVNEAIGVLIENLFKEIGGKFAIKLSGVSDIIIKNLQPEIEFGGLIPKLRIVGGKNRVSTELVLSEKVKDKLRNLRGKIIVIIDDLDRLTGEEALHFLRLTRVLKEIPNTFILLPIAKEPLIALLGEEKIANPAGYMAKLMDFRETGYTVSEAENYFEDEIKRHVFYAQPHNIADIWNGYLWEICLRLLAKYETQPIGNDIRSLLMDTKPFQMERWSLLDPLNVVGNGNFVLSFFEHIDERYTDQNECRYRIRVNENGVINFRKFEELTGDSVKFSEFFNGYFSPAIGRPNRKRGVFDLVIYNTTPLVERQLSDPANIPSPFDNVPADFADNMAKEYLWGIIGDIPSNEDNFPVAGLSLIGGRIVRRLIDHLLNDQDTADDLCNIGANKRGEMYKKHRRLLTKFVKDNAVLFD